MALGEIVTFVCVSANCWTYMTIAQTIASFAWPLHNYLLIASSTLPQSPRATTRKHSSLASINDSPQHSSCLRSAYICRFRLQLRNRKRIWN